MLKSEFLVAKEKRSRKEKIFSHQGENVSCIGNYISRNFEPWIQIMRVKRMFTGYTGG